MKRLRRLLPRILSLATLLICSTAALIAQSGPAISISPETLNFLQVKGGKFAQASFTITNTGSDTLKGEVETPGGVFQILDGDGSFALGPGDFQVVTVRFTPSAVRMFSDSIRITHNATAQTNPMYVYMTGTGVEAEAGSQDTVRIDVSPRALQFGDIQQGQSAQRTLYITNRSDSAMLVGSVAPSANPAFVVESGLGAFALAPNEVRPVTVRFVPTMVQGYDDSLMIVYSGTSGVETMPVRLSGNGTTMPAPSVSFAVTPEVVFFGNVPVGESGQRTVMVTNTGSAQFNGSFGSMNSASSFRVDNNGTGSFMLDPGQTRAVTVTFSPTAAGVQRDSLLLNVEGAGAPTMIQFVGSGVNISGGGQESVITIAPASIDFGNVTVGSTMQRQFTITNPSSTATLNGSVANPSFPFYIQGSNAGTFSLAPGENRTVTVAYSPTFAGSFSDNLLVNYESGANVGTSFVRLSGSSSAVVSSVRDESPVTVEPIASYPEPTTDGATLRFATRTSDNVRLAVFDARGREVARLVDGPTVAGEHNVRWETTDRPAGIYVVQLRTSEGVATGRVTVVR
jgi:hypothetical protein